MSYDGSGHLSSLEDPAGRIATVTTNASGRITRIDLEDGRHVAYTYGSDGYLATARDMAGTVLTYRTDLRGRIDSVRDEDGNVLLRNEFDDYGRVAVRRPRDTRTTRTATSRP